MSDSTTRGSAVGTIYIAGPMAGLPEFNYPAFHTAAAHWEQAGYEVLNPATNDDGSGTQKYGDYCRLGFEQVLKADIVALLPGWEASRGAMLEFQLANAMDLEVWLLNDRGLLTHILRKHEN